MAEIKWIKIATNIFDNRKIRQIETMPEGDAIIVIWFKLLAIAGTVNDNGRIYLTETIPYTDDMLAAQFNRPLQVIRLALRTFETFGMIERDEHKILISSWAKYQNVDGMERIRDQNRQRVAAHRERKALSSGNVTCNVTSRYSNAIEEDKEEDKEEDGNKGFATDADMDALAAGLTAVLDEAQAVGLPMSQRDLDRGNELVAEYGAEWVLEALKRTVNAPATARSWRYVAGILRNAKQEGGFGGRKAQAGTPDATLDELRGVLPK